MKNSFYNPFVRFSHQQLFYGSGLMTLLFSTLAIVFKGRFDGILDLHFVNVIKWYQPFFDNFLNIIITSFLLFVLGKLINPKTRIIDIINAVMLSRFMIYILLFFNANNWISNLTNEIMMEFPNIQLDWKLALLTIFGLFSLAVIMVYLVLMFLGFKVATNSKKPKHVLWFICTVLLAEFLLKLIFYLF